MICMCACGYIFQKFTHVNQFCSILNDTLHGFVYGKIYLQIIPSHMYKVALHLSPYTYIPGSQVTSRRG
jgi:hypothetical protein